MPVSVKQLVSPRLALFRLDAHRDHQCTQPHEGRLPSNQSFLAASEGAARSVRGLQKRCKDDPKVEVRAT